MNKFSSQIIRWYTKHGRHDLPWQKKRSPYRVWVSEIMLQQTQVTTVIPYFEKFMQHFPTLKALAMTPIDQVLAHWSGLGYYARARNLHRAAQIIHQEYRGRFPREITALTTLPGIGRSTAGAILSLAMNIPSAILDGNVKRVLARYHVMSGWLNDSQQQKQLWSLAEKYLPNQNVREYNQALMDLGATICTSRNPNCAACPLKKDCRALAENKVHLIPQAQSKRIIPTKNAYFLIYVDMNQQILLEKRAGVGLWASLWCFPSCDIEQNLIDFSLQRYGLKILQTEYLPQFSHKFSHFTLNIKPILIQTEVSSLRIMDSTEHIWYKLHASLPGGVPKPVTKLLAMLNTGDVTNELTKKHLDRI